ncbi:MAG TPA: hypothetical protein VH092_14410 [Urbifossiella sp.]|jgi:hypothetical protein|nr:hypothetical protein [Urbifossiella sp.]
MAPPRKVPPGSVTRSVLFRADQIEALDAAAGRLGIDLSDLVRGAVDLLFPLHPDENWARIRAALEVRRRVLEGRDESRAVVRAILEGWRGREPQLPLRVAERDTVRLVDEVVRMLGYLYPEAADRRWAADRAATAWAGLARDWAGTAPDALLTLLACPAVRCVWLDPKSDRRPHLLVIARRVAEPGTAEPLERQYAEVGPAIAGLISTEGLSRDEKLTEWWPFCAFPLSGFMLDWSNIVANDE